MSLSPVVVTYAWVKPLRYKNSKTVLHDFIEIVNESKRKPNKLWFGQGREFYNNLLKEWLDDNDILIYLPHNEVSSCWKVYKNLKGKIYKQITANKTKHYLGYLNKLVDK